MSGITDELSPPALQEETPRPRGNPLYWIARHTIVGLAELVRRRPIWTLGITLFVVLAIWFFRPLIHPYVIVARTHAFMGALAFTALVLCVWLTLRKGGWVRHTFGLIATVTLVGLIVTYGQDVWRYGTLYARYQSLRIVELPHWPITAYERIQPLQSIAATAEEKITNSQEVGPPDFVRIGDEYRWTIGIGPAYLAQLVSPVDGIFNVSATDPAPDWNNRVPVRFEVGEQLLLSRNTETCTIRGFGVSQYFNYQPGDVRYIVDDAGEWVQIVSLIRWTGFFFPKPEFGGVVIVRQERGSFFSTTFNHVVFGCGEWVPPEEVARYPYLAGQNLLPIAVSRYIAESFRFQGGLWAPLSHIHSDDVRIPDLAEDINPQPFTTFFEGIPGEKGKLYHFFALEPFHPDRQGLSLALFIPADGGGDKTYLYRPQGMTGVSAVAPKVRESRKEYDWTISRAVEHRPFLRDINGKRRLYWLTTVVTTKGEGRKSIAGSSPDLVLTDAETNRTFWVDVYNPRQWVPTLEKELRGPS